MATKTQHSAVPAMATEVLICKCHHPESDHRQDSRGYVHCNGVKPGLRVNQAMALPPEAICDCEEFSAQEERNPD